ncbi:hypothetical protein OC842_007407 [Tilletia horrida]|uniref:Uncharacterized protein n=1 Tax=Tilletia horrida TaxID=155126 RepID=A0AAN6G8F0_9BASI|nr:hypothetical protein OC842_007407 [Tilletia horrida]KAK0556115.1 hypothetical protein OC844_005938 [Tilletia horrida]
MSLSDLPGEVCYLIAQLALPPQNPGAETYKSYCQRETQVKLISKKFNLAAKMISAQHVHMFSTHRDTVIRARFMGWLPGLEAAPGAHQEYWLKALNCSWATLQNLKDVIKTLPLNDFDKMRTASIDLRIPEVLYEHGGKIFDAAEGPNWIYASKIMTKMLTSCRSLESLHIRIPPQQEFINMVQDLVARNGTLRRLVVEVDSAHQQDAVFRPAIHLANFCRPGMSYKPFERFVIRAPSASLIINNDVDMCFRLLNVQEFGIAVHSLTTTCPNWQWVIKFLHATPSLRRCEISVFRQDLAHGPPYDLTSTPVSLPHLTDFILQMRSGVHLVLRSMQAPLLMYLRIDTDVDIDDWVFCPLGHFPSIFAVNIRCPGQSAARLDALGIPRSKYYHNLDDRHNYSVYHRLEFLAYIKPYAGRRHIPSAPEDVVARVQAGRAADADAEVDLIQARQLLEARSANRETPEAQVAESIVADGDRHPLGPGRVFNQLFYDESTDTVRSVDEYIRNGAGVIVPSSEAEEGSETSSLSSPPALHASPPSLDDVITDDDGSSTGDDGSSTDDENTFSGDDGSSTGDDNTFSGDDGSFADGDYIPIDGEGDSINSGRSCTTSDRSSTGDNDNTSGSNSNTENEDSISACATDGSGEAASPCSGDCCVQGSAEYLQLSSDEEDDGQDDGNEEYIDVLLASASWPRNPQSSEPINALTSNGLKRAAADDVEGQPELKRSPFGGARP